MSAQPAVGGVAEVPGQLLSRRPDLLRVLGDPVVADRTGDLRPAQGGGVQIPEHLVLLGLDDGADLGDGRVHGLQLTQHCDQRRVLRDGNARGPDRLGEGGF